MGGTASRRLYHARYFGDMRIAFLCGLLSMASLPSTAQSALEQGYGTNFSNAVVLSNDDVILTTGILTVGQSTPVIRISYDGTVLWARSIPGTGSGAIHEKENGDLVIAHKLFLTDHWVPASITLSASGDLVDASYFDMGMADAGFGSTFFDDLGNRVSLFSGGSPDYYGLISMDQDGAFRWCRTFPVSALGGNGPCIAPGPSGSTMMFHSLPDWRMGFKRVSVTGETEIQRSYAVPGNVDVRIQAVARVLDDRWAVLFRVANAANIHRVILMFVDADGEVISSHAYDDIAHEFDDYSGKLFVPGNGKLIVYEPAYNVGHIPTALVDTSGQILHMLAHDTTAAFWQIVPLDTSWAYFVHSGFLARRPIDDSVDPCEGVGTLTHSPYTVTSSIIDLPSGILIAGAVPFTPDITTLSVPLVAHCLSTGMSGPAPARDFRLHPNPMQGDAVWMSGLPEGVYDYRVLDPTGKQLRAGRWASNGPLELAGLTLGTYILEVGLGAELRRSLLIR